MRIGQDGQDDVSLREDGALRKKTAKTKTRSKRKPPKTANKTRSIVPSPTERGTRKDVVAVGNLLEIPTRESDRDNQVRLPLDYDVTKRVGKARRNPNPTPIVEALPSRNQVVARPNHNQVAIRRGDAPDRTDLRDDRQAVRRARAPKRMSRPSVKARRRPPGRAAVALGADLSRVSIRKRFHRDGWIDSVRFPSRRTRNR